MKIVKSVTVNKNLGGEKKKKMKTKTKMVVLVEIAIVLCSLFLVAIPAIAAEQNQTMQKISATEITTTSEDDYVLDIYGNANEDDTIDMRDLTYVKLIFFGKKPVTELADAKYDGKINPLDFIQIKLIIVGKEKELTIVDSADRIVTVKKPIKRIVTFAPGAAEVIKALKAEDKIVGIDKYTKKYTKYTIIFPEISKLPCIGSGTSPDYEAVLALHPDVVFLYAYRYDEVQNTIESVDPSITVVRFDCFKPESYADEVEKLGYILEKRDEAKEFRDFYQNIVGNIKMLTEELSDDEKPRVYFESYGDYKTGAKGTGYHQDIVMTGGINIFGDSPVPYPEVDSESIIERDPEIIIKYCGEYKGYGNYYEDDTSEMEALRERIMNRPGWDRITAVKNGKVYMLSDAVGAARHFIGIAYRAKWFHPDLFEDLDPQAIHQEYLTSFQHINYNVYEHGVFVYPEPS